MLGKRTLGGTEVNNVAIFLEHVHLLNTLNGLHVELLERSLQLLVVHTSGSMDLLHLPSGSSFATGRVSAD